MVKKLKIGQMVGSLVGTFYQAQNYILLPEKFLSKLKIKFFYFLHFEKRVWEAIETNILNIQTFDFSFY